MNNRAELAILLAALAAISTIFWVGPAAAQNGLLNVPACGTIGPSQTFSQGFAIEPNATSVSFVLSWANKTSELEMTLQTPAGQEMDSRVEAPDSWSKSDNLEFFIISNPLPGTWTAVVKAGNLPSGVEDYCLYTFLSNETEPAEEESSTPPEVQTPSDQCEACSQKD